MRRVMWCPNLFALLQNVWLMNANFTFVVIPCVSWCLSVALFCKQKRSNKQVLKYVGSNRHLLINIQRGRLSWLVLSMSHADLSKIHEANRGKQTRLWREKKTTASKHTKILGYRHIQSLKQWRDMIRQIPYQSVNWITWVCWFVVTVDFIIWDSQ